MKEMIYNGVDSVREVVNRCLRGTNEETIVAMGNFENLYRLLRDTREKFQNPLPYQYEELKLSRNL